MKTWNCFKAAAAGFVLLATPAGAQSFRYMGLGGGDSHAVLAVRADGSCVLTNLDTEPRKSLEMQVSSWERFSKMSEGFQGFQGFQEDEDADASPPQVAKTEQKPLTNEELVAKIREMYQRRPDSEEDEAVKVESVDVSSNTVRVVTTRSFASLKDLLSQNPYIWGPSILMFENARVEIDTNQNLRFTFSSNQEASRFAKSTGRAWKSSKMKFDWKLVLPGKILTSGLPSTQATETGLSVDSEKPDTVDAALKLIGAPLVITAESGGIKLDEPLESKKLVRAALRQRRAQPDLPITEAGPGFQAEPVSITLSTVHLFPEGEAHFKNSPEAYQFGLSPTGAVVSAKLFPPKGREIRSVSGVRVKSAKDDKGRALVEVAQGSDEQEGETESEMYMMYTPNESEKGGAARIQLRMGLPAPDAKAIDELQCEAVALTIGGWKEVTITNVEADAKKEIDLSEILPGAKLTIKKVTARKPQKMVDATLEGPKEVTQIDVKIKLSNRRGGQSSMNERRSKTTGNKTTRNIIIQGYDFEMGREADIGPPTLIVRYPQDMKRERVQFKLTALDLL